MVVVNTHLYGAHLASGGAVLPPHQVVVFDEAHEVEEVMTDSLGVEIGPGRFRALAATTRPLLDPGYPGGPRHGRRGGGRGRPAAPRAPSPGRPPRRPPGPGRGGAPDEPEPAGPAEPQGLDLGLEAPTPLHPPGLGEPSPDPALDQTVALAAGRVGRLIDHLRQAERTAGDDAPGPERSRRDRALLAAGHLAADLARLSALTDDEVAWVDGGRRAPSLRVSPIDVGPLLAEQLWGTVTGVLTSATVPLGTGRAAGPAGRTVRRARRREPVRLPATTPCCTWPRHCPTGAGPSPSPPSTTSSRP